LAKNKVCPDPFQATNTKCKKQENDKWTHHIKATQTTVTYRL